MGNSTSLPRIEGFSPEEVSRLEKRFKKLDLDRSGSVSVGEFLSVPELRENPLVKRVVDVFDDDLSGEVDFKEFVLGLAHFVAGKEQEVEGKLKFAFKIYDMDRDGYISNAELFDVLKMMTGKNLTDVQLQQIVDKTICYLDKDADGKISYEEFCQVIGERGSKSELAEMLTVDKTAI